MYFSEKAVKMLDNLQDTFGRVLLSPPSSAQKSSLRAAHGLTGIKWRVWELKLHLSQAILRQEERGLAREVWQEQVKISWPGLAREVTLICKEIGLPDASRNQGGNKEGYQIPSCNSSEARTDRRETKMYGKE